MSIALITTRGYGNGSLVGTIKDVVLRGYTIGEVIASVAIGTRFNIDFFPDDRNITFNTDERSITFNAEDREILL